MIRLNRGNELVASVCAGVPCSGSTVLMNEEDLKLYEYYLKPGYIYLNREPSVISTVVGSCVMVSLWDCGQKYGGAVHYQYPFIGDKREATARY